LRYISTRRSSDLLKMIVVALSTFNKIRQILWHLVSSLFRFFHGFFMIVVGHRISHISRTRMDHNPNEAVGALLNFYKMIPTSQGSNLVFSSFKFLGNNWQILIQNWHPCIVLLFLVLVKSNGNCFSNVAHDLF